MKTLKEIFWIAFIILLITVLARAAPVEDLQKLIKGKTIVYEGTCFLNKKGLFPETASDETSYHPCVVGVDMNEREEIYYALIQDKRGRPVKLLSINKATKEQRVLWQSGTAV